jgi:hypothetical protein
VEPAEDLSHQLWTMRELLEQMVYKLEMQGLLLAAGRTRWLPFLNSEIESLMEAVNAVDTARSQASARLARRYGLRPDVTLSELLQYVEHPWGQLLSQHRLHLVSLQSEVEDVSNSNQELARRGLMRSREIIASLGEQSVDVYDPRGYAAPLKASALRLDRTV